MKVCTKCNENKLLSEYHKATGRHKGVKSSCKKCNKSVKQKHYEENKEKYKKCFQDFIDRNPDYQKGNYKKLRKHPIDFLP